MSLQKYSILLFLIVIFACSEKEYKATTYKRPNIVLLVADDLGYADLGSFGSDIQTPNIDALAASGIRFSGFHTAPMCSPTRAMLLSGNDNHIAGIGVQSRVSEDFGYEGHLTNRIAPVPALLKKAGYHTYMAGKWHLGSKPEWNPAQKGFERSYALLPGAGNHYESKSALSPRLSRYTEDGDSTGWNSGDYSTNFYTDKIIEYIDQDKTDDQPFFVYAAYTSPHWPLQVDEKYWKKYEGLYNDGYEKLKERRLASLKKAGIIPQSTALPPSHEDIKPWDSLTEKEQIKEARKMELYAGMLDNLDENIGRLVNYLKEIGEYDNTLFVFMSDNGAAPRDFINNENYAHLRDYYNDDYDNMGNFDSYISYGPQWAEAGSSPFRYYKDFTTQGGINTPMIISGPMVNKTNVIHHGMASVMDLAPTFYELAQIKYPDTFEGNEVYPLKGSSLVPFVSGKSDDIHSSDYVFSMEHGGNAMLRKGKWKITSFKKPFSIENFGLYDLSKDIGEQNDLKESMPDKFNELLKEWNKFAKEIQLPVAETLLPIK
jgi:arylsulfatase